MVWYSQKLVVIHTINAFSVVNEAEVDCFWNSLAFSFIQWMLIQWMMLPTSLGSSYLIFFSIASLLF